MSIASRLRIVLDHKGLTIKQASDLVGIPYRTLQNYLLEEREPNAKAMASLRTHLGISADWLISGEGGMFTASSDSVGPEALSSAESRVLEGLRSLTDDDRQDLSRIVERMNQYRSMERHLDELKMALADAIGPA